MCKGTANSNESYTRAVYRLIELFIQLKLFTMNNEVESKVKELIADKLNVELSEVTREANFTTDLGADSLDTVELRMGFEKEFDMTIPDEEAEGIKNVGDAIDYIEKHLS